MDASEPLELSKVDPSDWDEMDVGQFLTLNNCAPYCESFTNKVIQNFTFSDINVFIYLFLMKGASTTEISDGLIFNTDF